MKKQCPDDKCKGSLMESASARRDALAQEWLVAMEVDALLGSGASDAGPLATQYRRQGNLLGAWLPSEKAYRYPPWQFRPDGQPVKQVVKILRLLREEGGMARDDGRSSGWGEVEWFFVPHALLDGCSPAELLIENSELVLEAAIRQFVEDSNAGGF